MIYHNLNYYIPIVTAHQWPLGIQLYNSEHHIKSKEEEFRYIFQKMGMQERKSPVMLGLGLGLGLGFGLRPQNVGLGLGFGVVALALAVRHWPRPHRSHCKTTAYCRLRNGSQII